MVDIHRSRESDGARHRQVVGPLHGGRRVDHLVAHAPAEVVQFDLVGVRVGVVGRRVEAADLVVRATFQLADALVHRGPADHLDQVTDRFTADAAQERLVRVDSGDPRLPQLGLLARTNMSRPGPGRTGAATLPSSTGLARPASLSVSNEERTTCTGTEDSSLQTSFVVDDTSLTTS
jgi:hypothetical protein